MPLLPVPRAMLQPMNSVMSALELKNARAAVASMLGPRTTKARVFAMSIQWIRACGRQEACAQRDGVHQEAEVATVVR